MILKKNVDKGLLFNTYEYQRSNMKEKDIIRKIESGDESSLDYIYQKYYKMMVNMIIQNSGTETEAQDIYQEAVVVFWQKVIKKQLVLTSKISTYLYSICQNLWRKELERKKRLSSEEKDQIEIMDFDKQEKIKIVNECINTLGDTCRRVLTYYYFDGLSMGDIADKLGFSNADTAKTKKYKCKLELDKTIKSRYSIKDFMD